MEDATFRLTLQQLQSFVDDRLVGKANGWPQEFTQRFSDAAAHGRLEKEQTFTINANIVQRFIQFVEETTTEASRSLGKNMEPNYTLCMVPEKDQIPADNKWLQEFFKWLHDKHARGGAERKNINPHLWKRLKPVLTDLLHCQLENYPAKYHGLRNLSAEDERVLKHYFDECAKIDEQRKTSDKSDLASGPGKLLTRQEVRDMADVPEKRLLVHQAIMLLQYQMGKRNVRMLRLKMANQMVAHLSDEQKRQLTGTTKDLAAFAVVVTMDGDKNGCVTVRLDGMMRRQDVRLCAVSRLAEYLRWRHLHNPIERYLDTPDTLKSFLDDALFLGVNQRTRRLQAVNKGNYGYALKKLFAKSGVQQTKGCHSHRPRYTFIAEHIDKFDDDAKAARDTDHVWTVYQKNYAYCQLDNKRSLAIKADHHDGHVRLYRAGILASRHPVYKLLHEQVATVTAETRRRVLELVPPTSGLRYGVEQFLDSQVALTDVLLQDLVVNLELPGVGHAYLRSTDMYPFLDIGHPLHTLFSQFQAECKLVAATLEAQDAVVPGAPSSASDAKLDSLMAMVGDIQKQLGAGNRTVVMKQEPEGPQRIRAAICSVRHIQDHFKDVNPLAGGRRHRTCAEIYELFCAPLADHLPSIQEIMERRGAGSLRDEPTGAWKAAFKWMNRIWARVNQDIRNGAAKEDACRRLHDEYLTWEEDDSRHKGGRKDMKSWAETLTPASKMGRWWITKVCFFAIR
jgi:hypothetical protein